MKEIYLIFLIFGCTLSAASSWSLSDPFNFNALNSRLELAEDGGANCTKPGLMCDCDDVQNVFYCIANGDNFIKNKIDHCATGLTCIVSASGCSDQPNVQCGLGPTFEMTCTSDGIFPDPYNCKKYHYCVPKSDGTTTTTPVPTTTEDLNINSNKRGKIVEKDESKFLHYEATCDKGFGYDPLSTFCKVELPDDKCTSALIDVCKNFTLPKTFSTNPSMYYMCERSSEKEDYRPVIYKCPHGEPFMKDACGTSDVTVVPPTDYTSTTTTSTTTENTTTKKPPQPDTTTKSTSTITTTTPQTTTTPKTITTTTESGNTTDCSKVPPNQLIPDYNDCMYFYKCINSEAVRFRCNSGHSFNKVQLYCEKGYKNC